MTSEQIRAWRVELGLTVDELAFALNISEADMNAIEAGQSELHRTKAFKEAFDCLEERVFGTYVGA